MYLLKFGVVPFCEKLNSKDEKKCNIYSTFASTMTMNYTENHRINAFAIEENLIEKLRLYSEQSLIGKLFVNKLFIAYQNYK